MKGGWTGALAIAFGLLFSEALAKAWIRRVLIFAMLGLMCAAVPCRVVDMEQSSSSSVMALSSERASVSASIEVVQRSQASLSFAIGALHAELEGLRQKQRAQEETLAAEQAKIEEINVAFAERTQVKLKVQRRPHCWEGQGWDGKSTQIYLCAEKQRLPHCCVHSLLFSCFLCCCLRSLSFLCAFFAPFSYSSQSCLFAEELDALQRELDVDDGNLAEAERRVAAAMAAVTSLTDSIRGAKAEHKSAVREVRVLAAHQAQLDDDIAARTADIDSHDLRLQSRLVALKNDVAQLEVAIVASADQSKQIQEETVTLKQKVSDDTKPNTPRCTCVGVAAVVVVAICLLPTLVALNACCSLGPCVSANGRHRRDAERRAQPRDRVGAGVATRDAPGERGESGGGEARGTRRAGRRPGGRRGRACCGARRH